MSTTTRNLREMPSVSRGNTAGDTEPLALLGENAATQQLRQQVRRIAPYYRRALLIGEAGTGKELTARQLHSLSPVVAGPFIRCTAAHLAEDASTLETARRGTLYLEDLSSISLHLQDSLVRRLHELDRRIRARMAETRLIATSHNDLRTLAATGQFRQDLYACLSVVELRLLPLRDRLDDLEGLAAICLSRSSVILSLTQEAIAELRRYTWPGNLRELQQVLSDATANAANAGSLVIEPAHLPELAGAATTAVRSAEPPTVARLEDVMRRHVIDVLARCAGNKLKAAELLGISRSTLYRMLDGA